MARNRLNSRLLHGQQLARFGEAVVVPVHPDPQLRKHRVPLVDHAIAVSAVGRLIVHRQSPETVKMLTGSEL